MIPIFPSMHTLYQVGSFRWCRLEVLTLVSSYFYPFWLYFLPYFKPIFRWEAYGVSF